MGMTLAWRLVDAGHKVTVLEAAPQIGGLATWHYYGDFVWDKYYHVICPTDEHLRGLIEEAGVGAALRWRQTRTGFVWEGRHISMSSNWEFLRFPALSLAQKARLAAGILYCQRIEDPSELERITAPEWLRRIFGQAVYQTIWEPLLESKFGVLKEETPATIIWATIRRYYATRGKGGKEMMGFLSGGYRTLFTALLRRIESSGGEVLCRRPVLSVEHAGSPSGFDAVIVRTPDELFHFDYLISTLPTAALERLAPTVRWVGRDAAQARPRHLGVICLALVLRRPLSPYYVTNFIQRGFPFTGIIGVSNLTGSEELGGRHLAILPRYDVPESPWFNRGLEEVAGEFLEALRPTWPDIRQNVVRCHLNRERMVQALWIDGPPPALQTPPRSIDGRIWSVNAELTGRDTLNNNAIIRVANQAARDFLAQGARPQPEAPPLAPAGPL